MDIYFDFCELSYCSLGRKFYERLLEVFKVWFDIYPSPDKDFSNWLLPDIFGYSFQKYQLQLFLNSQETTVCWENLQLIQFFDSFCVCFVQQSWGKLSKTSSRNVNRVVSMVFIFAKVTILSNLNQGMNTVQIRLLKTSRSVS